jgi:hypothetical protein
MVFYYNIRGGQCRNEHTTITLHTSDIVCYVGRDKHENEFLIKYGWPSDIWFHVEGISSAHVYFRIKISNGNDSNNSTSSTSNSTSTSNNGNDDESSNASSSQILLSKLLAINGNDITNLIPIDNIPLESIEDMCQIVKHNSISGCKLSSCRIVYTPHSNLKKTFEMESGAVTYHNFKLQRFQRCDKNRTRIKELEKTKIERNNVQYFDEMKNNERLLINLRKIYNKRSGGGGTGGGTGSGSKLDIYDPMAEDMREIKSKATRQGDNLSGLDSGLSNLESLCLVSSSAIMPDSPSVQRKGKGKGGAQQQPSSNNDDDDDVDVNIPIWQKEYNERIEQNTNERSRFLLARGYTIKEIQNVMDDTSISISDDDDDVVPYSVTLAKLWNTVFKVDKVEDKDKVDDEGEDDDDNNNNNNIETVVVTKEQLYESRYEEREVLEAIYGEDEHVQFGWKNNDQIDSQDKDDSDNSDDDDDEVDIDRTKPFNFDSIFPITGYEPPIRYEYPPPLLMEIYVDNNVSLYPYNNDTPVLALVGGGIPTKYLRKITIKLYQIAIEHSNELLSSSEQGGGEPYLFDLLNIVNDFVLEILDEENIELQQERKQAIKKIKDDTIKAVAAAKAKAKEDGNDNDDNDDNDNDVDTSNNNNTLKFKSDADRRAYAQSIVLGSGMGGFDGGSNDNKNHSKVKTKQDYSDDAAASRLQEINDLFG